jgi:hypothetical protein
MSLLRPIHWHHSRTDLIWSVGPFKNGNPILYYGVHTGMMYTLQGGSDKSGIFFFLL